MQNWGSDLLICLKSGRRLQKEMQRCYIAKMHGNPGAVGSNYATKFAGVGSREEAIISQEGNKVG